MERVSMDGNKTLKMTGETRACLNIGSYNYLGFADDWQTSCKDVVMPTLDEFNSCMCSARMDVGTSKLHTELEELVARFVGKEAALVYNMGAFWSGVGSGVCVCIRSDTMLTSSLTPNPHTPQTPQASAPTPPPSPRWWGRARSSSRTR